MDNKKRVLSVIALSATLIITAGAAILLFVLLGSTSEEPEAIFGDDGVTIIGQYGKTYLYTDIRNVSLEENIPTVGNKLNGAGLREIKKGEWEVETLGRCRLFVMSDTGPYVVMRTSYEYVIINYEESEKTQQLYRSLLEAVE